MRAMLLGLVGLLSACSPAAMLNALAPMDGVRIETDLPYGAEPRQALDVYVPVGATVEAGADVSGAPASGVPVIVFLYGGGWTTGARSTYRFLGTALARRGHVVVIPDYRLFPEARFPDFVRDAALAVAWTRREATRFGADPRRLVVMGHSAGAHMALMLALDPRWLREAGMHPDRDLSGAIGLSGPYDFLPTPDAALGAIFPGDPRTSQPAGFARGDAVPVLLAHGRADTIVRPVQSERLAAAIRARGGRVDLRMYDGIGHAALIGAVASPLRWLAPVLNDIEGFVAAAELSGGWWSRGESNP